MQDAARKIELEDLHAYRRLQVGCPVYGDFWGFVKMTQAKASPAAITNVPYRSGYYDPRTGQFSPVPPPRP